MKKNLKKETVFIRKKYYNKKIKKYESLDSKYRAKSDKNMSLKIINLELIKKNIGAYFKYFKGKCDKQEEDKIYDSKVDGENSKKQKFYTLVYIQKNFFKY